MSAVAALASQDIAIHLPPPLLEASPLYFPTMETLATTSLDRIHQIWRTNNETLIGILHCYDIPHFGFHGSNQAGIEGITKMKRSNGGLWGAGIDCQLDPITLLADLYAIIGKASTYQGSDARSGAGLLVLRTESATFLGKLFQIQIEESELDSETDQRFIQLVSRNRSEQNYQKSGANVAHKLHLQGVPEVDSKELFVADEFRLDLDPTNYSSRVQGIILHDDSLYPASVLDCLQRIEVWPKNNLIRRLRMQETLVKSLDALEVLKDWSPAQLANCHRIGHSLSQQAEKVTRLSTKTLAHLKGSPCKIPKVVLQ